MKTLVILSIIAVVPLVSSQRQRNDCFANFNFNGNVPLPDTDLFSLNLFKSIASSTQKSAFLSPYGIWSALALAYLGSEGETERELGNALLLGQDKNAGLAALQKLRFGLLSDRSGPVVNQLDRAFFAQDMQIKQCIKDAIVDVETVDFNNPQLAANIINDAVSRATKGNIKSITDANALRAARMVLLNAIYFKGDWETKFNLNKTTRVFFTDENNARNISVITSMLQPRTLYKYAGTREVPELGAEIVEIPYSGGKYSMYAILPRVGESVDAVLQRLNPSTLNSILSKMTPRILNLAFPRFKMTTEYEDELKQVLQQLNIRDLFSSQSNLAGFTETERLLVDVILHKAVLEVNEDGTKASAATALIATRTGGSINPTTVIFNRPFIFFIRHKLTNTLLFAGTYRNPSDVEEI